MNVVTSKPSYCREYSLFVTNFSKKRKRREKSSSGLRPRLAPAGRSATLDVVTNIPSLYYLSPTLVRKEKLE